MTPDLQSPTILVLTVMAFLALTTIDMAGHKVQVHIVFVTLVTLV
jgi:hypothetical protein